MHSPSYEHYASIAYCLAVTVVSSSHMLISIQILWIFGLHCSVGLSTSTFGPLWKPASKYPNALKASVATTHFKNISLNDAAKVSGSMKRWPIHSRRRRSCLSFPPPLRWPPRLVLRLLDPCALNASEAWICRRSWLEHFFEWSGGRSRRGRSTGLHTVRLRGSHIEGNYSQISRDPRKFVFRGMMIGTCNEREARFRLYHPPSSSLCPSTIFRFLRLRLSHKSLQL